jgi:hypothetical protein
MPAMAAPMGRTGSVVYSPTVNVHVTGGGDPAAIRAAVLDALRGHGYELVNVIDRERERRGRARFE